MLRIIVDTEEEKEKLLAESRYLHDHFKPVDSCDTLAHLYYNPNMIEIKGNGWEEVLLRIGGNF